MYEEAVNPESAKDSGRYLGQRQKSVIYTAMNQYHVVMEVDPRYTQYPNSLRDVYVATSAGAPAGTALSNAPAGTVMSARARPRAAKPTTSPDSLDLALSRLADRHAKTLPPTAANNNAARNSLTNALANRGKDVTSAGAAVSTARERMIPLAAISRFQTGYKPLFVHHRGLLVASTISFNRKPGSSLGQAAEEINRVIASIDMPASIALRAQAAPT